ncbi:hypothetical protein L1887_13738 [Cichorium endivia]|nr:hypothetical protein L1887_13738 [Cichorium endivia]
MFFINQQLCLFKLYERDLVLEVLNFFHFFISLVTIILIEDLFLMKSSLKLWYKIFGKIDETDKDRLIRYVGLLELM